MGAGTERLLLNTALSILDWGDPVSLNHTTISSTAPAAPSTTPTTVLVLVG